MMWDSKGGVYMYIYVPKGSEKYQKPPELRQVSAEGDAGISVFRDSFPNALAKGAWHNIQMGMTLNTFEPAKWHTIDGKRVRQPKADGVLYLRTWGHEHRLDGVILRLFPQFTIDNFIFNVFHGGGCTASKKMNMSIGNVALFDWTP